MTIAGGMVCADGVLLFADTEWTASTLKIQRPKHWAIGLTDGSLTCAAAGAGDEDYVKFALQRLVVALGEQASELHDKGQSIRNRQVLRTLEETLAATYQQHIYPDPRGADHEFGLVMAVSDVDKKPALLKTSGTTVVLSDSYEYVYLGSGAEFASYLTQKMWRDQMPLDLATYLASYVLWETKQHVKYCGGESVIYRLKQSGAMQFLGPGEVRDYESHFEDFDRLVQRIRLQSVNNEMKDEQFEEVLADFCRDVRFFREARAARAKVEKKMDELNTASKPSASQKSEQEP